MKRFLPFLALLVALLVAPVLAADLASGLDIGGEVSAYNPEHLTGPDKGTKTCPVCKYGNAPAVQVWVNSDADSNVEAIAAALHTAVKAHPQLHAFITVIGKPESEVQQIANKTNYPDVAITYLDGVKAAPVGEYKINIDPKVTNTIFVSRDRTVKSKFVGLVADARGVQALQAAINGLFS